MHEGTNAAYNAVWAMDYDDMHMYKVLTSHEDDYTNSQNMSQLS